MDRDGSGADPLARFPRRPHRLAVLVVVLVVLGLGTLAWRKSHHRWPRANVSESASDVTETDAAQRINHTEENVPSTTKAGGHAATGFHPNH